MQTGTTRPSAPTSAFTPAAPTAWPPLGMTPFTAPTARSGPVGFFRVTSADGTHLQAWTNDVDGSKTGPVVLLCNGLGTNPWTWPTLLEADTNLRVISWYHRGVGGSARPADASRVRISDFVDDAQAVLDAVGVEQAIVAGWSIGVNTAFHLAHAHPERVAGLFAVAGVPGKVFDSTVLTRPLPLSARTPVMMGATQVVKRVGRPLSWLVAQLPIGPRATAALTRSGFMLPTPDLANTEYAVREFLTTPMDWYMHLALGTCATAAPPLEEIKTPTMVVAGRFDALTPAATARAAAARLPHMTYVELAGSHFLAMEKPAELQELLEQFVGQVSPTD